MLPAGHAAPVHRGPQPPPCTQRTRAVLRIAGAQAFLDFKVELLNYLAGHMPRMKLSELKDATPRLRVPQGLASLEGMHVSGDFCYGVPA